MKIKLQDYSLISNKWIDDRIKLLQPPYISQRDAIESESIIYELEKLKQQLIPSEKLAEVCLVKGGHIEAYSSEPYNEKQEFLKSEIQI
jgi:hypothetical protein